MSRSVASADGSRAERGERDVMKAASVHLRTDDTVLAAVPHSIQPARRSHRSPSPSRPTRHVPDCGRYPSDRARIIRSVLLPSSHERCSGRTQSALSHVCRSLPPTGNSPVATNHANRPATTELCLTAKIGRRSPQRRPIHCQHASAAGARSTDAQNRSVTRGSRSAARTIGWFVKNTGDLHGCRARRRS